MTARQQVAVICDSYGEHSPRLTTFRIVQSRSLHAELGQVADG